MNNVIEFIDVKKVFDNGSIALNNVSFFVKRNQFVSLLGKSGAGKSTIIRLISGLDLPTSGDVIVDKRKNSKRNLKGGQYNTGVIFQYSNLIGNLSVMLNVLSGGLGTHKSWWSNFYLFPITYRIKALELLNKVGLLHKSNDRADQLSGGEQQRVNIARALMQNVDIILADEPVASLDPTTSADILSLLKFLCEDNNISIICSLHQPEYAMKYSDQIIGLNRGRVVYNGPPSNINLSAIYD